MGKIRYILLLFILIKKDNGFHFNYTEWLPYSWCLFGFSCFKECHSIDIAVSAKTCLKLGGNRCWLIIIIFIPSYCFHLFYGLYHGTTLRCFHSELKMSSFLAKLSCMWFQNHIGLFLICIRKRTRKKIIMCISRFTFFVP